MHWIVGAVLHATVIAIISFFILFAASKADGFVAMLGRLLGYWVLLIAVLALAGGVYFGMSGKGPADMWHGNPGPGGWMHRWGPPGPMMQPPPPGAPAPATPAPATPAPATPAPTKP